MAKYEPGSARSWALSELTGCCGCVLPTFTSDLSGLDEEAIRNDVRLEKSFGMKAILVVAEGGTTLDEYIRFVDMAVDEAGDDLVTFVHASQPTWDGMVALVDAAASSGADLVLPAYPLTYHPVTLDELFTDTAEFVDRSPLGVMLFAIDQWNFSRLHPAAFPTSMVARLVDQCPNLVGVKTRLASRSPVGWWTCSNGSAAWSS